MTSPFDLPAGYAIGVAPPPSVPPSSVPPSPPQDGSASGSAPAQPAASASSVPAQPSNPYALPPGFAIGTTAPGQPATSTNYIDISLSGQDADQTNKPPIPVSQLPQPTSAPPSGGAVGSGAPGAPQPSSTAPASSGQTTPAIPAIAGAGAPPVPLAAPPPPAVTPPVPTQPAPSLPPAPLAGAPAGETAIAPTSGQSQTVGPDPNAPASPGWTLPYAGHLAGLGARNLIEGGVGLGLGPAALAARGVDYLTGSQALAPLANAPQGLSNLLTSAGFAQPQNTAERYGSAIAENVLPILATAGVGALPGVAGALSAATIPGKLQMLGHLLMAGAPKAAALAAPGAGAGALQQYAAEHNAGPGAQLAAALLGGVAGGGLANAARAGADYGARLGVPLTGGRAGLAGQALLSQSSEPTTFGARLAAGTAEQNAGLSSQRLPTSPATAGMLARDQGMMGFEQGVRNTSIGNDAYRDFDHARAQSQVAAIKDLQDPGAHSAAERGFTIRNGLDQAHDAAANRTSEAYGAAAPTAPALDLNPVHQHIASELSGVYGPLSGGAPPALAKAWRELAQRKTASGIDLTRMSKRLGNMAGSLKMGGDRIGASAAMRTRDAVDNLSGSPAWEQARAMRRSQGEAFGRNAEGANAVGGIRAEDRFGSPTTQDDRVADRAIKDGAAVRQVTAALQRGIADARASAGPHDIVRLEQNAADVRTAMREHFIDGLMRKGSVTRDDAGNETVAITPKQWSNYWRDRKDVADQLFTPGERALLDNDFAEMQRFQDAGKASGSNTAKNGATAKFMKQLAAGKIPGELRTARLMAAGIPLALAKGATSAVDAVAPGVGHGLEHAAHRGAEYYFLTKGGHGGAHGVLAGVVNPGAHAVAERVQEAAGSPEEVQHLVDAVRAGKVSRIAASVAPRPMRRRLAEHLGAQLLRYGPVASQAQQGNEKRAQLARALANAA